MADDFQDPGSGTASKLPGGFRAAVTQELKAIGFTVTQWHEDGLDCEGAEGHTRYVGLSNLYRKAKNADRADWPQVIRDFLRVIILTVEQEEARVPDDLAATADRLLVRVGKPFTFEPGKGPWQRRLPGTDLTISLVIDSDRYMTYATEDLLAKSDRPPGDWLDVALANLKTRTPDGWLAVLHEETGLLCGHCDDSYDASRALILSEIQDPGPAGWLLCVPARDWLFALPVTLEKLPHFHLLKVLAEKNYATQPYPISDQVFWVRGRKWEVFKVEVGDDGVKVYPSQAFAEALGMVAEGEEGGESGEPSP